MLKYLFCKSPFTIQCALENKIETILLANTYANEYNFINEKFIKEVCHFLKLNFNVLSNLNKFKYSIIKQPNLLFTPFSLY